MRAVFFATGSPGLELWGKLIRNYFLATGYHCLETFLSFQMLLVGCRFLYSTCLGLRVTPIPPSKTRSRITCGLSGWWPGSNRPQWLSVPSCGQRVQEKEAQDPVGFHLLLCFLSFCFFS